MLKLAEAPGASNVIDLHGVRAGLPLAAARIDQADALARQALPEVWPALSIAVGDQVRYRLTGEIGRVAKILPGPIARAVIVMPSGQVVAWVAQCGEPVALPSDCEAVS